MTSQLCPLANYEPLPRKRSFHMFWTRYAARWQKMVVFWSHTTNGRGMRNKKNIQPSKTIWGSGAGSHVRFISCIQVNTAKVNRSCFVANLVADWWIQTKVLGQLEKIVNLLVIQLQSTRTSYMLQNNNANKAPEQDQTSGVRVVRFTEDLSNAWSRKSNW